MSGDQGRSIRFDAVTADGLTEIVGSAIQVTLPSGLSFRLEAQPGRDGSVVCIIDGGSPDAAEFSMFQIEPGAANLFAVNVKKLARRRDQD